MPHNPPTGEELEALKRVMLIVHQLDELKLDKPNTTGMVIHSGHATDGVRVNGQERLINVLDILDDIRKFVQETAETKVQASENWSLAKGALADAEHILTEFVRCTECQGSCGRIVQPDSRYPGLWVDCKRCNGRGLVMT